MNDGKSHMSTRFYPRNPRTNDYRKLIQAVVADIIDPSISDRKIRMSAYRSLFEINVCCELAPERIESAISSLMKTWAAPWLANIFARVCAKNLQSIEVRTVLEGHIHLVVRAGFYEGFHSPTQDDVSQWLENDGLECAQALARNPALFELEHDVSGWSITERLVLKILEDAEKARAKGQHDYPAYTDDFYRTQILVSEIAAQNLHEHTIGERAKKAAEQPAETHAAIVKIQEHVVWLTNKVVASNTAGKSTWVACCTGILVGMIIRSFI